MKLLIKITKTEEKSITINRLSIESLELNVPEMPIEFVFNEIKKLFNPPITIKKLIGQRNKDGSLTFHNYKDFPKGTKYYAEYTPGDDI